MSPCFPRPSHQIIDASSHSLCLHRWARPDAPCRLLALHGFAGDGLDFAPLFEHLAIAEHAALDLLGHGKSDAPCSGEAYRASAQVAQLDAVLSSLRGDDDPRPLFLLGYSMGGRLLLQWLCEHARIAARELAGVVLIGASPGIEGDEERRARQAWDESWACRAEQMGVASFMRAWRDLPIIRTQERMAPEHAQALERRRASQRACGLAGSMRGFGAGQMPSCWSWITRSHAPDMLPPLLFLAGEEDPKYAAIGERLVHHLPGARRLLVPGAGHAPHFEASEQCASLIRAFMKAQGVGEV